MGFGIKELVVILIIVILLFGTKKLKGIGTDLGSAIKGFKKSMSDDGEKKNDAAEEKTAESLDTPETESRETGAPDGAEKKDHTA